MKTKNCVRDSNIELLRIISIILIMFHHFSYHNDIVNQGTSAINKALGLFTIGYGKIGVLIFILITGYYMIEKSISIKKVIKLWLEIEFYTLLLYIVTYILNNRVSIKDTIHIFLPLLYNTYWFMTAYIGLYFCIPLLNRFINSNSKEINRRNIFVLFLIFILSYSIFKGEQLVTINNTISNIVFFCYIYYNGAYIKKYDIKFLKNKKTITIILLLIILMLIYFMVLEGIYFFATKGKISTYNIEYYYGINSLFTYTISILVFYIFAKRFSFNNRIINYVSKSVLAIYLFQSHPIFGGKNIYKNLINSEMYYYNDLLYLYIFIYIIVIVILVCIIEIFRKYIEKKFLNSKVFKYIENKAKKFRSL